MRAVVTLAGVLLVALIISAQNGSFNLFSDDAAMHYMGDMQSHRNMCRPFCRTIISQDKYAGLRGNGPL